MSKVVVHVLRYYLAIDLKFIQKYVSLNHLLAALAKLRLRERFDV